MIPVKRRAPAAQHLQRLFNLNNWTIKDLAKIAHVTEEHVWYLLNFAREFEQVWYLQQFVEKRMSEKFRIIIESDSEDVLRTLQESGLTLIPASKTKAVRQTRVNRQSPRKKEPEVERYPEIRELFPAEGGRQNNTIYTALTKNRITNKEELCAIGSVANLRKVPRLGSTLVDVIVEVMLSKGLQFTTAKEKVEVASTIEKNEAPEKETVKLPSSDGINSFEELVAAHAKLWEQSEEDSYDDLSANYEDSRDGFDEILAYESPATEETLEALYELVGESEAATLYRSEHGRLIDSATEGEIQEMIEQAGEEEDYFA